MTIEEGSVSKIAFGNMTCVVDLLVLCREKLRRERYFDMNYFCQLALLDICVCFLTLIPSDLRGKVILITERSGK